MKEAFHKILSLLMAFVVLFSTMSFTVDMHYCGDILVDTAIFSTAKSCGMEMNQSNSDCVVIKKNCCTEKQLLFEGQDELEISYDNLSFDKQVFIASFVYSFINNVEFIEDTPSIYNNLPPPKVVRQLFKLDEAYLI